MNKLLYTYETSTKKMLRIETCNIVALNIILYTLTILQNAVLETTQDIYCTETLYSESQRGLC